jgi:ferritin-like metal-binding protein YciE
MAITTTKELLKHELEGIYFAEGEFLHELKEQAAQAEDEELKEIFRSHAEETKRQRERLEEVFTCLGEIPKERPSEAAEGLLEDREEFVHEERPNRVVQELFDIWAAMKAEHLEIISYEGMAEMAAALELEREEELLRENLNEEKEMLLKLQVFSHKHQVAKLAA